jgi:hypothetical protein
MKWMGRLPALIIMLVNIFRVSFTKPDLNEEGTMIEIHLQSGFSWNPNHTHYTAGCN